ncbi:DMT family transporter [Tepidimicrobium xylanilyticum]|uniref:Permease of the drug/metabolite transporter (DMT) superfamily n=1 Tax=Tepidimicrobium xylanilyticum TaxID=1123352 RepID=A0A1H2QHT6_9FIRM|nr:DMT family transporter [Tepidimicrobium xylanilyticum]GMG95655.1 permease [Tepidimicrobium xylanilyticum]SDW06682.1 Permease of the drug/metabolite transporter (DMT) superfamily [Tepidimicrobium xylanilyticum]
MEKFLTKKLNILIISLLCMALWGSAFPVVKIGYELFEIETADIFGKIYFAGLRFFIASIMVFMFHRILFRKRLIIKTYHIKPIIILGLLQTSLQYFFFYIGVANTSGIKSAILQSGSTFFVVIMAHFLYKEDRLDFKKTISLLLGFAGVIIINLGNNFDLSFKITGEGFLLMSSLLSALATIYVKNMPRDMSPFLSSGGQMFTGSLLLLLIGKIGLKGNSLNFNFASVSLLLYAAFISAAAFTLWYMILRYNSPGRVSIYRLFIPIFGSIFSVLLIEGEYFTINLALGLLAVVLGIGILNMDYPKKAAK